MFDTKTAPDEEYVYFLTDGRTTVYFKCIKERHRYSRQLIRSFVQKEWNLAVEGLHMGKVTHLVRPTNVTKRPDELDAEGRDEDGNCWGDYSHRCDYALIPVELIAEEGDGPVDGDTDDR